MSLRSGRDFVISSKPGGDLKRNVGVSGRNSFSAIEANLSFRAERGISGSILKKAHSRWRLRSFAVCAAQDDNAVGNTRGSHIRSILSPSFKVTIAIFH